MRDQVLNLETLSPKSIPSDDIVSPNPLQSFGLKAGLQIEYLLKYQVCCSLLEFTLKQPRINSTPARIPPRFIYPKCDSQKTARLK